MHDEYDQLRLIKRIEWLARLYAMAVGALGIAVLIGWALDIGSLKSVLPGWVSMKPNTALCFVLACVSLTIAGLRQTTPGWKAVRLALAATVTLIGLLTLGEYVFAVDFGIDQLLFTAPAERIGTTPPGRMAPATATAFAFTGLALCFLDARRGRTGSQVAATIGILIGFLAILGYAYSVEGLYGVGAYSSVALHTAVGIVLINSGVLFVRPRRGLMAVVTDSTAGGVMARRLLPMALIAPFLLGWLCVLGEQIGLYKSQFGTALVALAYVILFAALTWRTADLLRRSDQQRAAAERIRRQQEQQMHGIVNSAMDAIVMTDSAQRIVLFNPAAEEMFGRKAFDVLGGPHEVLLPARFKRGHAEQMRAFGATGSTSRRMGGLGEIAGVRADGREFPIEASISQVEADNQRFYTVILRDITEKHRAQKALTESEQRYKTLAAGTFEGIVVVSENGTLLDVNAQFARMLGYEPEELIGHTVCERVPPEVAQQMTAHIQAGDEFRQEHELRCKDGSRRLVETHGRILFEDERAIRLVAFHDITERKWAEDGLRVAIAEAERANNAKSRFLAAASHDLRQPLSALKIYVDVLRERVDPADQKLLANMKDCVSSLSGLLNDLLDLSKLEAGVVKPNVADFPFADALAELASIHAPEALSKGLRLRCVPAKLAIRSDRVLLRRILSNLISNAIRYTERGGIVVGCRRRQGKIWVEVWDSGIGIAEDKRTEIFEDFKQIGDDARNGGSGLGLAIVAKTAALLGLEIRVRSWPTRGSVFALELPLGKFSGTGGVEPTEASYRSIRIALVEDNAMVRKALAMALRVAGHQVVAAASGDDLLAQLGDRPPAIVVADYRLPKCETGFDVIEAVRRRLGTELPGILITGDTDPSLLRVMDEKGLVVLRKPVDLETLQAYIEDLTYSSLAIADPDPSHEAGPEHENAFTVRQL